jgi:hypothetical protein
MKFFQNKTFRFVSLTLIFTLILLSGAIIDSVKQKSFIPLVDGIGGQIFASDYAIEQKMIILSTEENRSVWTTIKSFFSIFGNLWILYLFWNVIFKIIGQINDSERWLFGILSLAIVWILETWYVSQRIDHFYLGFKGVFLFIANIDYFFNPVKEGALRFIRALPNAPELVNETLTNHSMNVQPLNTTMLING